MSKHMSSRASSRLVKVLAAAVFSIVASGCTNMSGLGGSSEFQCKAPEGIPCQSVSGVYANDMADNLPSIRVHQARTPNGENSNTSDQVAIAHAPGLVGSTTAAPALGAIRSEPTVIRIWMAPWEDADGDLNEESRVYLQIDNGRWLIEHNRDRIRAEFAPATPVTFPPAQVPMGLQSSAPGAAAAAHPTPQAQPQPGVLPQQPSRIPAGVTQPTMGSQR
jgi:conjugal transfer pilus assembly protein TraV